MVYPGEGAQDLGDVVSKHAEEGPPELLFVDGTWAQAKRLMGWWPALRTLPRVVVGTSDGQLKQLPHPLIL